MANLSKLNRDQPSEGNLHFVSYEDFIKYSTAYTQLHQKTDHRETQKGDEVVDTKWTGLSLKRELVPGQGGIGQVVKVKVPVPFPRTSVLNNTGQWDYMFFLTRFMKDVRTSQNDPVAVQQFLTYQNKLREEHDEFQKFAREVSLKSQPAVSQLSQGDLQRYLQEAWKSRLSRVEHYPRYYGESGSVVLVPKEASPVFELKLEKTLLEMGKIPRQVHLQVNTPAKLQLSCKKLNHRFPPRSGADDVVSLDGNASKLSEKYAADLVLSSSVLKALVLNMPPQFNGDWEIPFEVRQKNINGETHRFIYLDKPLPPREMNGARKMSWLAKFAAKMLLTHPNHPKCFQYPGSTCRRRPLPAVPAPSSKDSPEVFASSEAFTEDLDIFGVDKTVAGEEKVASSGMKESVEIGYDSADLSSDNEMVIDAGDLDPGAEKKSVTQGRLTCSTLDDIIKDQDRLLQGTKKKLNVPVDEAKEDPADYIPPARGQNVTYRLWTLRCNQRELRLVIRTRADAAIVTEDKKLRTFQVFPKLEHQPWYGVEHLTPAEISQQWISAYVRPESRILRVRIDAFTGDVMMTEQKDAFFLEAEAKFRQGPSYSAAQHLAPLWAVLSGLEDLKPALNPGQYILQHRTADGLCARVLRAQETPENSYDLHGTYAEVDVDVTSGEELPNPHVFLDPWTVTPTQRATGRPPVTFEPPDADLRRKRADCRKKPKNQVNSKKKKTK